MSWKKINFGSLYLAPTRNGIYKDKSCHGSGVKIVNMGEIFAYDFIGSQDMQRIEMTPEEMQTSGLKENDLLFARRSLVESGAGKASIVTVLSEPTTFESSIIRVRLDSTLCYPLFYLYWFRCLAGRAAISALVTGLNVKGIRGSELKGMVVDYPPIETQKRIAGILKCYDNLIETKQKQIKLLEEAAQRLYKEWFVDRRFPGHENTPLVDGVPEGWTHAVVTDLLDIKYGKDHKSLPDGDIPVYGSGGMMRKVNKILHSGESVLIPRKGSLNNILLVSGDFWTIDTMFFSIPKQENVAKYVYLFLCGVDMYAMNIGAAVPSMTVKILDGMKLLYPKAEILAQFENMVGPYFSMIDLLRKQIGLLTEARDMLLPKLMNGEIEV